MRAAVAAVLLCGCSQPHRSSTDVDAAPAGDADTNEATHWRPTTAIVVGGNMVLWSRGAPGCSLEGPSDCTPPENTLLVADLASGTPQGIVQTRRGMTVVGDATELFYINVDTDLGFVARVRAGTNIVPVALSVPRMGITNLSVDSTYVYWFEPGVNGDAGRMRRTSRSGDGSDVVDLPGVSGGTLFAGYFWTTACSNATGVCSVARVPVNGGTPEDVASEAGYIVGSDATSLFLVQMMDATGYRDRLLAMSAAGSIEVLTDYLPQYDAPVFGNFVSTGSELFWPGATGELQRLPRSGGVPTKLSGVVTHEPFVVTNDAILFDFTETGYDSASL